MVCRSAHRKSRFFFRSMWKLSVAGERGRISLKAVSSSAFDNDRCSRSRRYEQSRLTVTSVIKVGYTSPPGTTSPPSQRKQPARLFSKTLSIAQSLYEEEKSDLSLSSRYISESVFENTRLAWRMGQNSPSRPTATLWTATGETDHHAIITTGETPSGLSADETAIYKW